MGGDINAEAEGDAAGRSVTINADGTIVAIGAIYNDHDSGIDSGHVRVYQYVGNTWTQLGQDIDGVGDSARFGVDVALSDDGMVLAVGSNMIQEAAQVLGGEDIWILLRIMVQLGRFR